MTHEEYLEKLMAIRKEYADAIRERAVQEKDNFNLIMFAEIEAAEYHLRVGQLIQQYQEKRVDNPFNLF